MSGIATQAAAMLCSKDTVKATGLNIWVSGEQGNSGPEADIIAVQGLGAHPYYTWVGRRDSAEVKPTKRRRIGFFRGHQENAQADGIPNDVELTPDTTEVMWLRDILPDTVPNARISTYSYESDWRKADVKTSLRKCGEQLLNVLYQTRFNEKEARRPLIFIGHSLGGLIIKQALVLADHGNTFSDIRCSTAGIIFLGTPHQGSESAAYGVWLAQIVGHDPTLLESLRRNSPVLHDIARDFEASYSKADIVCFYEDKDISYGPLRTQFVNHQSASLNGKRAIYLTADHSGLNKFCDAEDENFLLLRQEIQRVVQIAPRMIEERYRLHDAIDENTKKAQTHRDRRDEEETKLLKTLASDYKSEKDLVSTRVPGTCEWFFKDGRFLEWRDSSSSRLLWVSAGPGCGKSVLARALIDERRVCTSDLPSKVCYFFFKDGQEQRTRGADALSAILHQLFENSALIRHALPIYERYGKKLRDTFSELWRILVTAAEGSEAGDIICILDALDECEENARNQLVGQLVGFFSQPESSSKLKFLITSRPYDDVEEKFQRLSDVSTYIHLDGDEKSQMICQEINLVIDAKIPHITGGFNYGDRERITNRLKKMENRTYLWLFLTIDIIEKSPSRFRRKTDVETLLSNLPSKVSDAYERIPGRSEDEDKARILLEFILAATRPLSLKEANMALAIATREENCRSHRALDLWPQKSFTTTVKNMCGLFVSVHNGHLFLIHQTAREFLIRTYESAKSHSHKWKDCLDMVAAHGTMSRTCLDYLNFEDVARIYQGECHRDDDPIDWQPVKRNRRNNVVRAKMPETECHLLDYAAHNWATHYNSQPAEFARDSRNAAKRLCNTSLHQGYWFRIYCASVPTGYSKWTELGIASLLGLAYAAEDFLNEGADANAQGGRFGSALQTASAKGHDQIVRMLLDKGANVNAQSGRFCNALQAASHQGYAKIVRMLLEEGADVKARVKPYDGRCKSGNALETASDRGHYEVTRVLLEQGAMYTSLAHDDVKSELDSEV